MKTYKVTAVDGNGKRLTVEIVGTVTTISDIEEFLTLVRKDACAFVYIPELNERYDFDLT